MTYRIRNLISGSQIGTAGSNIPQLPSNENGTFETNDANLAFRYREEIAHRFPQFIYEVETS